MKRLFFLLLCVHSLAIAKGQDMVTFFINIPDHYLPQLEEAWRKDLVDLIQSGKSATLDNTMNGRSTLQTLTSDYLYLQTSERSTMEIRFLPLINNTLIACVITTVYAPVADSRVEFFSTEWQLLPSSELWIPANVNWFIKKDINHTNDNFQKAMSYIDLGLIHYRLDPEKLIMEAKFTTPDYLSHDESETVKPYLNKTPIVYQWRAGKFQYIQNEHIFIAE